MSLTFIDPQQKLFSHLGRLADLQAGKVAAPINAEIDLSNRCSLGCEWCHFAYTHTRGPLKGKQAKPDGAVAGGDLMDEALALSIVDQLSRAGVASLTWTGGGEPTLHPAFDKIVDYAHGKIAQGLYTHGGHVDAARASLLKRALTFAYVSLDAADQKTYLACKGVDRFFAACAGIARLVEAKGDATVGIGYLVTSSNWGHCGEAVRLAVELGVDYIQFRPTIRYDQHTPNIPAEDTGWVADCLDMLGALAAYKPGLVIVDRKRFIQYQRWAGHGYPSCWWSALQTVITPNGKVWACVNKREHGDAEIGDLSAESWATLWARRPIQEVDGSCRVMCRGHLANQALDSILQPRPHPEFV